MEKLQHRTVAEIKRRFCEEGVTVRDWAIQNGFAPQQVYQVLAGRVACNRGASHQIAQKLGLKPIHTDVWFAGRGEGAP